ncbi:MAG: hypothetical protein H7Y17_04865, partial [Chlorobia bacterium]|nr:hypothetical protein [Fimbriimonadaceae bacterium]
HEAVAEERAFFAKSDQMPDAIYVFSDGIQHLVVDPISGQIHRPFFERVFGALCQPGEDERASQWLAEMAQSEPVRRRTDDDIGIAIARRLGP